MLWSCPTDQRFCYWAHLPDNYYDEEDPHYKLLVIIHGTGCATENYVKYAKLEIIPGFAHEGGEKERVQAAQKFFKNYL